MNSENNLFDLNISKTRGSSRRNMTRSHIESNAEPKTPLKNPIEVEQPKTPLSSIKNIEAVLTPRRSVRKSIKPAQDYDEIVLNRRALRSHVTTELESEEHKWTPAKVGRVSQKRKGRSGKKSKSAKKVKDSEENVETSEESEGNSVHIENIAEDVLSTTFDMEDKTLKDTLVKDKENSLEDLKEKLSEVDLEQTEQETKMQCIDMGVIAKVEKSEAHKKVVRKEIPLKTITDDIIEEINQLGCTPIVYDENHEMEEEVSNEPKNRIKQLKKGLEEGLGCTSVLSDDKSEKISVKPIDIKNEDDFTDEVFEEAKKDIVAKECEKSEVIKKDINAYVESEQHMVYEPIEILSDDDMMSLVVSDDEEMGKDMNKEKLNGEKIKDQGDETEKKESLNDTFNMSDCIVISSADEQKDSVNLSFTMEVEPQVEKISLATAAKKVKELQANYFSPSQKPSALAPKIVVTNDKDLHETLLSTPKITKKRQNIGTPISGLKRLTPISAKKAQNIGTPLILNKKAKSQTKGYRFPTPYKSKKDFCFDKQIKENENQCVQSSPQLKPEILTNLEPKEIVLRSIRKRSLSVTIDGDQRKRKALNVTFYSPANQTATIDDLDNLLAKSAAKIPKHKNGSQRPENVTQRKRSISLDDQYLYPQASKLPRPVQTTPQMPRGNARTRLPNFAAIHQQQFQKMENLVDYVARKAERAQNLTNSALKSRNVSAPSPARKKQKSTVSKALVLSSSNKVTNSEKPLAYISSKADVSNVENLKENSLNKLKTRTQRHIEMFKARPVDSKSSTRKNDDIIRGVRSNRRFELMMQHRKTSGN